MLAGHIVPGDLERDVREQRGANADENVRAQPRGLARDLALQPDRAAEDDGERELEKQVDAERGDKLRDIGYGC
jgi:hypothetical protein